QLGWRRNVIEEYEWLSKHLLVMPHRDTYKQGANHSNFADHHRFSRLLAGRLPDYRQRRRAGGARYVGYRLVAHPDNLVSHCSLGFQRSLMARAATGFKSSGRHHRYLDSLDP